MSDLDLESLESDLGELAARSMYVSSEAEAVSNNLRVLQDQVATALEKEKEKPVLDPTELTHENVSTWANSGAVLEMGSEGVEVTIFEKLCNRFDDDYYPGKIDDKFGKGCHAAAQSFQQGRLLTESGVVDEETKATMLNAFEAGWHPGQTFVPPWRGVTRCVIGPWLPKLGILPGLRLGRDERGKMSTFGGPHDSGDRIYGQAYWSGWDLTLSSVLLGQPLEDLAAGLDDFVVTVAGTAEPADWAITKGCGKVTRAGESSMLNPDGYFIAMMFDRSGGLYNERNPKFLLWSKKTGKAVVAMRTDKGPHPDTGRWVDMSDGCADALYLEPDDNKKLPTDSDVYVTYAPASAPLGPVTIHEDD